MRHQHTLKRPVEVAGVGLHSGADVTARLLPAPPNTGVVFHNGDHPDATPIPARYTSVQDTRLATTLGNTTWRVSTVEHLLAALWASGLSNVIIEITGGEVPVLDGSAAPWCAALSEAGRQPQAAARPLLVVTAPVSVRDGARRAELLPGPGLELSARIDFSHPLIGEQALSVELTASRFETELSWARTFGFLSDVEALRAAGLARGGGLNNAVVYDGSGVLNPEGLRGEGEAVRHKLLDMVGDLALTGVDIQGRFRAIRPGHALNLMLVRALFEAPSCWRMTGEMD
ncbi:MAG: UDP-3-O-[3-hydroxymyristoyl] N-acetylglucosamine deacetylase [Myxococcota bacterium]|jgi:UDP-3-O-[3-hydroxymyristoyl] N-acetylglucosamine deacetylase